MFYEREEIQTTFFLKTNKQKQTMLVLIYKNANGNESSCRFWFCLVAVIKKDEKSVGPPKQPCEVSPS